MTHRLGSLDPRRGHSGYYSTEVVKGLLNLIVQLQLPCSDILYYSQVYNIAIRKLYNLQSDSFDNSSAHLASHIHWGIFLNSRNKSSISRLPSPVDERKAQQSLWGRRRRGVSLWPVRWWSLTVNLSAGLWPWPYSPYKARGRGRRTGCILIPLWLRFVSVNE